MSLVIIWLTILTIVSVCLCVKVVDLVGELEVHRRLLNSYERSNMVLLKKTVKIGEELQDVKRKKQETHSS